MRMILSVLASVFLLVNNSLSADSSFNQDDHNQSSRHAPLPFPINENSGFDEKFVKKFFDLQEMRIGELSESIASRHDLNDLEILKLLNERGIIYFLTGRTENAIDDFDQVISSLGITGSQSDLLGTALWTRMLCHAFNSQIDETYEDSLLILSFFNVCSQCVERFDSVNNDNSAIILPVVRFENPSERISLYECHDRTKRIANLTRDVADLIPVSFARTFVHGLIDRLSRREAHECCERGRHWTDCLYPIANAWKQLEHTWEKMIDLFNKGIDLEQFLTAPNNL